MIISQTPLRISLCGGGTDFYDYYSKNFGMVISTAIDKYVFVFVKQRFDEKIYVDYASKEIVDNISQIKHELVRETAIKTGMTSGFEVAMFADIPSEGSGLGSSSSLTVGLLNAFYSYKGVQVTAEQLAREACEIEIDILKKPIGKQDQYIAAYGGLRAIKFNNDEEVLVRDINLNNELKRKLGSNLLLFFTNITRTSSSILSEQKSKLDFNRNTLDEIKSLTLELERKLNNGDIDFIGETLKANWTLKKKLSSNITNAEIEKMYETAINIGALGGKIAGAGGGGFLMVYCKRAVQDSLREAMKNFRELPFLLEPHGSKIIFNYRRYDWK